MVRVQLSNTTAVQLLLAGAPDGVWVLQGQGTPHSSLLDLNILPYFPHISTFLKSTVSATYLVYGLFISSH